MTQGKEQTNTKILQGWFCDKVVRRRLTLDTTSFVSEYGQVS